MRGEARLDPARGEIVGRAAPTAGRPARIVAALDGRVAAERLAVGPDGAFAFRLPREAEGRRLEVTTEGETLLEAEFTGQGALARYREGSEMADFLKIERLRFSAGRFRGEVIAAGEGPAPEIALRLRGEVLARGSLAPKGPGRWSLDVHAPAAAFGEGVAVLEFAAADGSRLAAYPLAAGAALEGDLVAEVASLRAELDLLKQAFREAMAGGVLTRSERPLIVAEALAEVDALLEMRDRAERSAIRAAAAAEDEEEEPLWEVRE
ncbi:MAG: hypothetical protein ACE37J_19435 [Pikeienuella sp.]|uniref:hypothetical protein n=1 Tax=Pikeienuella sp. TaxID=2831957 RepID=UPI00391D7C14